MARTVLLADDSVTAQNMGRRILTDAGYEVITVNNGSAALKKIHEKQPDLIVLDVYMPGYGGLEVCQRLKESEATMRIPVLLTVGKMEPFKAEEAKRVRADGHIVKPFDASELLAALTKLEDKIVPVSENGRGRKSDGKKSRGSSGRDPAVEYDEGDSDRVAYLQSAKNRQTKPLPGDESSADRRSSDDSQEKSDEAVTFAAGPIYEPRKGRKQEPEKPAPEFPVEKDSSLEAPPQSTTERIEARKEKEEQPESPVESQAAQAETSVDSEPQAVAAEQEPAVQDEEPANEESGPRWVAETVALSPEEAAKSLDEEMRQAQSAPAEETTAQPSEQAQSEREIPEPVSAATAEAVAQNEEVHVETAPEPEPASGAAFAAAASASGSSTIDAVAANASGSESSGGSEAAAAWENSERSRESAGSQTIPESLVQSVTEMAQRSFAQEEPAKQPEPSSASEQAASPEPAKPSEASPQAASGDALSSIVDSVLAELKPRLLAEIAKQLSTDKK
ncbi:MAG TPA: response regulator [Terriglobales bacterium]|nr:response regulator [Terriglobales bacterium]